MTMSGEPLIYTGMLSDSPIVSVTLSSKWYTLYLITPNGEVLEVDDSDIDYCDNNYKPSSLIEWCEEQEVILPDIVLNVITGRWLDEIIEHKLY